MEAIMRMLMHVTFPVQEFNQAVRDGSVGQKIARILEDIKPEAVYFTEECGERGAILIVNVDEPAKVPVLAEPWFLSFNACVKFRIVMNPEDLKKAGLDELGKKWA
jgi:hypothetical protein